MLPLRVGPYRLHRSLGQGATGRVFVATAPAGTRVAVKLLHPELFGDPAVERRWLDEARIGTSIEHENVVHVLDAGLARERGVAQRYLVMEYVEGESLRDFAAAAGAVPESACLEIGRQLARALDAIHRHAVVHSDLKPENVLVARGGTIKVADLGVAAVWNGATRRSTESGFAGTFLYAAPEQLQNGRSTDGGTDLYALGLILHELATGRHPFEGLPLSELIHAQLAVEPRPLAGSPARCSPFFSDLVRTLLAKDAAGRFETTADALDAFERRRSSRWWRRRGPRRTRPAAVERRDALFVGRRKELSALRGFLAEARAGRGRAALVTGEAGVGKSRLVARFLAEGLPAHALVLRGSYPLGGAAPAAWAYVAALREWLARAGARGPAGRIHRASRATASLAALIEGRPPRAGAPRLTAGAIENGIGDVVASLARERPVVLVVEDLHFAGAHAGQMFGSLAERWSAARVLLVGTSRTTDVPETVARIALPGLPEAQLREAVGATINHVETTEAVFDAVWRGSHGNPFVALEMLRDLRERRALQRAPDGTWRLRTAVVPGEPPSALRRIAESRLSRVSARDRTLVEAAALLAGVLDVDVLAAAVGEPPEAVRRRLHLLAARTGLLRRDASGLRFDHDATVEAIRGSLRGAVAKRHHARIADAIASVGDASLDGERATTLCEHLFDAGRAPEIVPRLESVLSHLESTAQSERCLRLLDRMLAAPGVVDRRLRAALLLRRETVRRSTGWRFDDTAGAEEARALAVAEGDPVLECRAIVGLIHQLTLLGRHEPVTALAERALALSRRVDDPALRVKALMSCTMAAMGRRDRKANLAFARAAVRVAERTGDADQVGVALVDLITQYSRWDDARRKRETTERGLALLPRFRDLELRVRMRLLEVDLHGTADRWRESARCANRVLVDVRRLGLAQMECSLLSVLSSVHYYMGEFPQARRCLERSMALAARSSNPRKTCEGEWMRATIARAEGRWADAIRSCEIAERGHTALGDAKMTDLARRVRGAVFADLGRFEAAEEILGVLPPAFRTSETPNAELLYGQLHLARGDAAGGLARWERAIRGFREEGIESTARSTEIERDVVLASIRPTAEIRERLRASLDHARRTSEADTIALNVTGLALTAGMDRDEAVVSVLRMRRHLSVRVRLRCQWLLWRAGGDPRLLRAAKADLRFVMANAPFEDRAAMTTRVELYGAIAAARALRGLTPRYPDPPTGPDRRGRPTSRGGARRVPRGGAVREPATALRG